MKQQGWQENEEWKWVHPGTGEEVKLKEMEEKEKGKMAHTLREAWRWKKWQEFQTSGRRETREVRGGYDAERVDKNEETGGARPGPVYASDRGVQITRNAARALPG